MNANPTNPVPQNKPAPQGMGLAESIREPELLHEGAVALKLGLTVAGFREKAKALNFPSVSIRGTAHYRPTAIQAILDKDKQGRAGFFAPPAKVDSKPVPPAQPAPAQPAQPPAPMKAYVAPHLYPTKAQLRADLGLNPEILDAYIGATLLPVHDHVIGVPYYDDIKIKQMIKDGTIDFRVFPDELKRDSHERHNGHDIYRED